MVTIKNARIRNESESVTLLVALTESGTPKIRAKYPHIHKGLDLEIARNSIATYTVYA